MWYLQFLELFQFGEQAGWQLIDAIFIGFQLNQIDQRLECTTIQLHYLIVIQESVKQEINRTNWEEKENRIHYSKRAIVDFFLFDYVYIKHIHAPSACCMKCVLH